MKTVLNVCMEFIGINITHSKDTKRDTPWDRKLEVLTTVQNTYAYHPVVLLVARALSNILRKATLNVGLEAS